VRGAKRVALVGGFLQPPASEILKATMRSIRYNFKESVFHEAFDFYLDTPPATGNAQVPKLGVAGSFGFPPF
jgi:hypothetical protein